MSNSGRCRVEWIPFIVVMLVMKETMMTQQIPLIAV